LNLSRLAALGEWMLMHGRTIQAVQWCVVAAYVVLVVVPAFLPIPPDDARWYDNLVVAAQWLFWGLWWPFVIASMFVLGRTWCGVFCPEGTLTEAASRHGLGLGVPRWMRWGGWPFVAFTLTTVFGQLVSVYQYANGNAPRARRIDARRDHGITPRVCTLGVFTRRCGRSRRLVPIRLPRWLIASAMTKGGSDSASTSTEAVCAAR